MKFYAGDPKGGTEVIKEDPELDETQDLDEDDDDEEDEEFEEDDDDEDEEKDDE